MMSQSGRIYIFRLIHSFIFSSRAHRSLLICHESAHLKKSWIFSLRDTEVKWEITPPGPWMEDWVRALFGLGSCPVRDAQIKANHRPGEQAKLTIRWEYGPAGLWPPRKHSSDCLKALTSKRIWRGQMAFPDIWCQQERAETSPFCTALRQPSSSITPCQWPWQHVFMHSDYSTSGNVLPYRVRSRECHTSVTLPSFMQSYITHVSFLLSVTAVSTSFPAPFYEAITVPFHGLYNVSEHLFVLALEQRCAESSVTLFSAWVSEIAYSFMGAAL